MMLKVIDRDPSLPHQIIIGAGRHAGEVAVSCNCLGARYGGYKPIEHVPLNEATVQKALAIYHDPGKHNPEVCKEFPFHPDIEWGERHVVEVQ